MFVIELPCRRASVVLRELGMEAMLYDAEGDKVVRLNPTARRIWEMCDGHHSLDVIADALQQEFAVDPSIDLQKDVAETIARFAAAGLLTEGKVYPSPPTPLPGEERGTEEMLACSTRSPPDS